MAFTNETLILSVFEIFNRSIVILNGTMAYCANSVLIFLILFHSPKHMGTYRHLMLCFSIFSIIYVTIHIVVMPNMHVYGYGFCLIPTSFLIATFTAAHWGMTFWGMLFTQSLVLISFHFFYRYCLICRTSWLIMFNRWKYLPIWVSIWAFMGLCCASFLHFFMYHTPEFQAYFRDILWETYHFDVNTTAILGPLYKKSNEFGEEEWDLRALFSCSMLAFLHGATIMLIAFCTYQINKTLKTSAMSEKSRRLQYEFFRALLVQTLIPTIFEYIPFVVIFSSPLFSPWISVGRGANFVPIAVSFYPMIDPICIIYFIKDYRFVLLKNFKWRRNSVGITKVFSEKMGSSANPSMIHQSSKSING